MVCCAGYLRVSRRAGRTCLTWCTRWSRPKLEVTQTSDVSGTHPRPRSSRLSCPQRRAGLFCFGMSFSRCGTGVAPFAKVSARRRLGRGWAGWMLLPVGVAEVSYCWKAPCWDSCTSGPPRNGFRVWEQVTASRVVDGLRALGSKVLVEPLCPALGRAAGSVGDGQFPQRMGPPDRLLYCPPFGPGYFGLAPSVCATSY